MWLPGRVEIGLSVQSWVEGLCADKSLSMEHQKKKPQEKKKTCINVLNGTNDLGEGEERLS